MLYAVSKLCKWPAAFLTGIIYSLSVQWLTTHLLEYLLAFPVLIDFEDTYLLKIIAALL